MTDAYKKRRDEAAKEYAKPFTGPVGDLEKHLETVRTATFKAGADWAAAYERERASKLVEALKWALPRVEIDSQYELKDKQRAHVALAEYEAAHE